MRKGFEAADSDGPLQIGSSEAGQRALADRVDTPGIRSTNSGHRSLRDLIEPSVSSARNWSGTAVEHAGGGGGG